MRKIIVLRKDNVVAVFTEKMVNGRRQHILTYGWLLTGKLQYTETAIANCKVIKTSKVSKANGNSVYKKLIADGYKVEGFKEVA